MAGPDSLLEDFMRDREDLFDSVEETSQLQVNDTVVTLSDVDQAYVCTRYLE